MRAGALAALLEGDARSVVRDPLLAWMITLPIALALLLRILIPAIEALPRHLDLVPLRPLIMGGYLMTAPGIVGMVLGFLLLDERDERTLEAIRVTPLSEVGYLGYRMMLPLFAGTLATLAGYPLVGVAPLRARDLLMVAGLAGLSAPIVTLVLATAAPNKVAGLALVKVVNAVNLLPVVAFFLPLPVQAFAGVIPSYWPMRALWSAAEGESYRWVASAGMAVNLLFVASLVRLFTRRLRA